MTRSNRIKGYKEYYKWRSVKTVPTYEVTSDTEIKDLACSCQYIFELMLEKVIDRIIKLNFSKNIVYAGGCALNSLANMKIVKNKYFEKLFIPRMKRKK